MNIDSTKLRDVLTQKFNSDEFVAFCFDYFPEVYDRFGEGMKKGQQIQLLLDFCYRRDRVGDLLKALKEKRPDIYDVLIYKLPVFEELKHVPRSIWKVAILVFILISLIFWLLQSGNLYGRNPPKNAKLGDTWTRPTDGMTMVFVRGDTFTMGSSETEIDDALALCKQYRGEECQLNWFEDEVPRHNVRIDSFWIDQHEITNARFTAFLNAEDNQEEGGVTWLDINSVFVSIENVDGTFQSKAGMNHHPVIEVSWYGANAYCKWVGGQLPTEGQWEYAARGEMGNIFPWGDEFDSTQLNYCDKNCKNEWNDTLNDNYFFTAPVGNYNGNSWVGAQDMAGNVWEWTADWYDPNYYYDSPIVNPIGPDTGPSKVQRGGAWHSDPSGVRSTDRFPHGPDVRNQLAGFRCVIAPAN